MDGMLMLADHMIPKGWMVLPYFRSVHFNPAIYPDPYTFNPFRHQVLPYNQLISTITHTVNPKP